jgi:hypothetical protein
MDDKTIIHFEGKDMPARDWLDLDDRFHETCIMEPMG